jgi:hypothetical protein
MFPRRVLITETISLIAPLATMGIVTLASILGLTPRDAHRPVARAGGLTMEDAVRAVDLSKTYGTGPGRGEGAGPRQPDDRARDGRCAARAERLGQVHAHQGPGLRLAGRHR